MRTIIRTYYNTTTGKYRTEEYQQVNIEGFNNTYKDSQGHIHSLNQYGYLYYLHPANFNLTQIQL